MQMRGWAVNRPQAPRVQLRRGVGAPCERRAVLQHSAVDVAVRRQRCDHAKQPATIGDVRVLAGRNVAGEQWLSLR